MGSADVPSPGVFPPTGSWLVPEMHQSPAIKGMTYPVALAEHAAGFLQQRFAAPEPSRLTHPSMPPLQYPTLLFLLVPH